MKTLYICGASALLLIACTQEIAPENNFASDEFASAQITEIHASHQGKSVSANCQLQTGDRLLTFTTPSRVNLPISMTTAAPDVVITCEHQGVEKSALLQSQLISEQANTATINPNTSREVAAGEMPVPGQNLGVSQGVGLLALGLSANVVPANAYVYPRSVGIGF